jgi:putative ABC transport system permease protein
MRSDVRLAWRALVARPALTTTALATFAVGIGVTTAMSSIVDGVLLRPLPFDQPDRIVRIFEEHPGSGTTERRRWMSSATLDAWVPRTPAVAAIARYGAGIDTVGREQPERMASGAVSASLFDVLGARPLLGRLFVSGEEQDGRHRVVILGHALWQSRFGGHADAVGQTLVVNGEPHEIVGVMPETFAFPTRDQLFWRPNVTRPLASDGRQFRVEYAIARLADGATSGQAAQEGTVVARAQTRPMAADLLFGKGGPVQVHAVPLAEEMTASVRPALMVASAGVAMVLLLACANVANLFLSRGVSRQREFAVRAALGASRIRLMRQALMEGLLLSVTGGVLGMALAWSLLRLFPAVAPSGFPRLDEVGLHWRVLLASLAVSLGAGALAALVAGAALHWAPWSSFARLVAGAAIVAIAYPVALRLFGQGGQLVAFFSSLRNRAPA